MVLQGLFCTNFKENPTVQICPSEVFHNNWGSVNERGETKEEEEGRTEIMDFWIASPNEEKVVDSTSPVQVAVKSGIKTALLTASAAAIPTLIACRTLPWAKANLNHTAQALIISAAGIAGFFITADKSILESARGNTIGKHDK